MKILSDEDGDTIWSDPLDIPRYIAGKTREHLEQCREEATQVETLASKIREEKEDPMNTDLDKRLQEILTDIVKSIFGDQPEATDKEIIDFYVSAIHSAFKDARYASPDEWLERFMKEMEPFDNKGITRNDIFEAARTASGVSE